MSQLFRKFPPPPPNPRQRVVMNRGDRNVGVDLPMDGESPYFDEMNRLLSEALNALWMGYAPQRMVKIGHPNNRMGVYLNSIAQSFKIPYNLVDPFYGMIPLLVVKDATPSSSTPSSDSGVWVVPRLALNVTSETEDHLSVQVNRSPNAEQGELGEANLRLDNNYGTPIYVRGAIYFPQSAPDCVASRVVLSW